MTTTPAIAFEHSLAEALEGTYVEHPPAGFPSPTLLELNRPLLEELGLGPLSDEEAASIFSGTTVPAGARPIALAYAGHQFGQLSPQLGDGRAVLLGEIVDRDGRRFDIQLKGSGRTPFSRGGDGKATLGPILRELLVSEAMAHLGIRTSRVLAAVSTGEEVRREWLLPGAVLARVAASHLRVGSLEFLAVRGQTEKLGALVRYALARHYPEHADAGDEAAPLALLHEVAKAQARLIASWMHVGFIHGVMNTDNVSLSGETIDYGPCAFMEAYDPETVFSSIDRQGRYAYGNQPSIGVWNTVRMAEAVLPLVTDDQARAQAIADEAVDVFRATFNDAYLSGLQAKIGLNPRSLEGAASADDEDRPGPAGGDDGEAPSEDVALMTDLLGWMHSTHQDFTLTFRRLACLLRGAPLDEAAPDLSADTTFAAWQARWEQRLGEEDRAAVAARMDAINPLYLPRNHLVEEALAAAHEGDLTLFHALMDAVRRPFEVLDGAERFALAAPKDFGPYRTFCGT